MSSLSLIVEHLLFGPLVFLSIGLIILLWPVKEQRKKKQSKTKWFLALWLILFVGSSTWFFQLVSWPLKEWTPKSQKQKADVIVVATAGVHESGAPSPGSTIRAHTAAQLYLEGWAPLVLVTGGVTHPYSSHVDAKGMHIILRGMGVPDEDILIEDKSVDTYTNSINSHRLLQDRQLKKILLVTHDYHLLRLSLSFEKLGIETIPYAANVGFRTEVPWWKSFDWANFNRVRTYAHEYLGLLMYRFMDRI